MSVQQGQSTLEFMMITPLVILLTASLLLLVKVFLSISLIQVETENYLICSYEKSEQHCRREFNFNKLKFLLRHESVELKRPHGGGESRKISVEYKFDGMTVNTPTGLWDFSPKWNWTQETDLSRGLLR